MAPPESTGEDSYSKRTRAKRACKECNARRVRCDVSESGPCSNCTFAQVPCEIVPSRRGKYTRLSRKRAVSGSAQTVCPTTFGKPPTPISPSVAAPEGRISRTSLDPVTVPSVQAMNEPGVSPVTFQSPQTRDTESTLFFGESNLLTCVIGPATDQAQSASTFPPQSRMSYPITNAISDRTPELFAAAGNPAKAQYLLNEGSFTFADTEVCLAVLQAYFEWFHPCFPVLDRFEIYKQHNMGQISPLLFQAILFIGASYCDEDAVHKMGFKDRPDAKQQLYNRAKALFDLDWESNNITILQSLFLISFWRAGPLNVKNTRYWLGAAIALAQTRGFHRSTRSQGMDPKQEKMRKRIWWSIYVRDRQSSASLGLPNRIRDEDCDVEMLTPADLEEDWDPSVPAILGSSNSEHIVYAVWMARVARVLEVGKIISKQFAPSEQRHGADERPQLAAELEQWKAGLPEEMKFCGTGNQSASIWTYLLHLAYNHLYILLYRSAYLTPSSDRDSRDGEQALRAACSVTRIVEDMLSQNLIQFGQMHLITSLFSSLCIHTINLQRSKKIARTLAEHRAQICLIGLKEIQKYWEVNNLVLDLFFQYLDEPVARRLRKVGSEEPVDLMARTHDHKTSESDRNTAKPKEVSPFIQGNEIGGAHSNGSHITAQPLASFSAEDPFFFNLPGQTLNSSEGFNAFLDTSMFMNDGLNEEGLNFLQRCL